MTSRTKTFSKSIGLLISLSMIAALVGCSSSSNNSGGGGGGGTTAPSVSLSTAPTSLAFGGTFSITATVTNDSANGGVTWSCTPGNSAATCGSFSASKSTSGTAVTYTAPSAAASVVITATVVDDTSVTASTPTITVSSAPAITVTLSTPPPSSLVPSGTATIAATVANDSANKGVTWTCSPAATCGSFNPTSTASAATTVFTAGTTTGDIVITATSVSATSVSASANVTVTTAAAGALTPSSNYVFSLTGEDANGFYTVAGAFTLGSDGATITTGEQDFSDFNTYAHDAITGGSIAKSSTAGDTNLIITLTTADTSIGVSGVETLSATLLSSSKAQLVEFDSSASSSGELDVQATGLTGPSGGYAFVLTGLDSSGTPVINLGGVINVDSAGGISGAGSVFDMNDVGSLSSDQSFTASTVSSAPLDPFGLITFTLNSSLFTSPGIVLTGYMVDSSHIRLVENWTADTLSATTGGVALGQTGTGSFTTASVSGSNFVYGAVGADANGPLQEAGLLTFNSDGSVSGNLSFNDFAAQSPQGGSTLAAGSTTIGAATYAVDATGTGRLTVTGVTDNLTSPTFIYDLQLYLDGNGHALIISMDNTDGVAGSAFQQTGPFTAASFTGSYGLNVDQQDTATTILGFEYDGAGTVVANGSNTLTGFLDITGILNSSLSQVSDDLVAGSFSANANGIFTGTIQGISTTSGSTADNFTYYLVDTTKAVAIENDTDQLTLGVFQLQR